MGELLVGQVDLATVLIGVRVELLEMQFARKLLIQIESDHAQQLRGVGERRTDAIRSGSNRILGQTTARRHQITMLCGCLGIDLVSVRVLNGL